MASPVPGGSVAWTRGACNGTARPPSGQAALGKYVRAEPVAALCEQGRIHHAGAFDALAEELMAFGGEMEAAGSLDRADGLVWAITDLLIDAPDGERGPRVRWL